MNTFPNLNIEATSFKEESIKPVLKSSYDGGYEIQRLKYSRTIRKFTFTLKALSATEADTVSAFFEANQGVEFIFVHPVTSVNYTVRFDMDSLKFDYISPLYKSTNIILKEV
jgi:hypothetical protein